MKTDRCQQKHLLPLLPKFYHLTDTTVQKVHNVNQNVDHIRIYSHSAKFFVGNFYTLTKKNIWPYRIFFVSLYSERLCSTKGMNSGFGKLGKNSYICVFNNYILKRTDIYESK